MIASRVQKLKDSWTWVNHFKNLMPPGFESKLEISPYLGPYETDRDNVELTLHNLPEKYPIVRWASDKTRLQYNNALFVISYKNNGPKHKLVFMDPTTGAFSAENIPGTYNKLKDLISAVIAS